MCDIDHIMYTDLILHKIDQNLHKILRNVYKYA